MGSRPGESRKNAGRKQGIPNKRTLQAITEAEAGGVMPLPALLEVMRWHLGEVERLMQYKRPNRKRIIEALEYVRISAKDAAPFLHATIKARVDIPLGDAAALSEFANARAALVDLVDRVSATIPEGGGTSRLN